MLSDTYKYNNVIPHLSEYAESILPAMFNIFEQEIVNHMFNLWRYCI